MFVLVLVLPFNTPENSVELNEQCQFEKISKMSEHIIIIITKNVYRTDLKEKKSRSITRAHSQGMQTFNSYPQKWHWF